MEESIKLGNHLKNNSHLFGERKYEFRYLCYWIWKLVQPLWKKDEKYEKKKKTPSKAFISSESLVLLWEFILRKIYPCCLSIKCLCMTLITVWFYVTHYSHLIGDKAKSQRGWHREIPQWVSDRSGSDLLELNFLIIAQAENI